MPITNSTSNFAFSALRLGVFAWMGVGICGSAVSRESQMPAANMSPVELEVSLFLIDPHLKNPKGVAIAGALTVVSVPQPIEKYSVGKSSEQCATIDYGIRTTTKAAAMCQKLPPKLRNLPLYPAGMPPNRLFSMTFFSRHPM